MLSLPGYKNLQILNQGRTFIVYRATHIESNATVTIKTCTHKMSDKECKKLTREYEIGSKISSTYVIKYIETISHKTGLALIANDPLGIPLNKLIPSAGFTTKSFLEIAINIVQGLRDIHSHNVVHNDVKADNIIVLPDGKTIQIIDFGNASLLKNESKAPINVHGIEGTLSYISPEQTGKINRLVDYRTDFYSLGVTLYYMACGQLPFASKDPLMLLHDHIAKEPTAPHLLKADIPSVVSNIILKLMMKSADDRYQNCNALFFDLTTCLEQLMAIGKIDDFDIAQNNYSENLHFPQKLYGRETEIKLLQESFEAIYSSKPQMFLVAGHPGIGKSALVNEIQKPLTIKQGYFISGKFDQLNKNIAYSAIVSAFRSLMNQILTESEEKIAVWKTQLSDALGDGGQLLVNLIPELEYIVGKLPDFKALEPIQEKNRLDRLWQNFIKVFATPAHPLVLFLDDLQWADLGSLHLIEVFSKCEGAQNLLLIGAYRNTEVSESHPVMLTISELDRDAVMVRTITMTDLSFDAVNHLIADTFYKKPDQTIALSSLIYEKTAGNPFFVRLFMQSLYDSSLIKITNTGWAWDLDAIKLHPATDNVIELMTYQLKILPLATLNILKLASCLGNRFSMIELNLITQISKNLIFQDLKPALDNGVIYSTGSTYQFAHDKVQEAAYNLIEEKLKLEMHLLIGRSLHSQHARLDIPLEKLFDIVDHFNKAYKLIVEENERIHLANLNYLAGVKAKSAAAYTSALSYLDFAELYWSSPDKWEIDYEFTYHLNKDYAEVKFLCGEHDSSKNLIYQILPHLHTAIEKVELYNLLLLQETFNGNFSRAAEIGHDALQLLEIELILSADTIMIEREKSLIKESIAAKLTGKPISTLSELPFMTVPHIQSAIKILYNLYTVGYLSNVNLMQHAILMMVKLSLEYGNTNESAFAYVTYGSLLCASGEDYQAGSQFGELALQLSADFNSPTQKARCANIMFHCIQSWTQPLQTIIDQANDAFQAGLISGEIQYAGYINAIKALALFHQGTPINRISKELEGLYNFASTTKNSSAATWIKSISIITKTLKETRDDKVILADDSLTEHEFVKECDTNHAAICFFYIMKAQVLYLYGSSELALLYLEKAKALNNYIFSQYSLAIHTFYHSLVLCDLYSTASIDKKPKYWEQLLTNQAQMKNLAETCSVNFAHKYHLIAAEMARLSKDAEACRLYSLASKGAAEHGFIQEHALACELAAKYWLQMDDIVCARAYINEAQQSYNKWGAISKSEQIRKHYRGLANTFEQTNALASISSSTISTDNLKVLDFAELMKASQIILHERKPQNLLTELLQYSIKHTGAETGAIIFVEGAELFVQAEYLQSQTVKAYENLLVKDWNNGPHSILNFVFRTKSEILLGNASYHHQYKHDPYFISNKTKSVICLPIVRDEKLKAILYLQNNTATHTFTTQHIDFLSILNGQMITVLENIKYYEEQILLAQRLSAEQKERVAEAESFKCKLENFIDTLCHEIRNPLNAVAGNTSILRDNLAALDFIYQQSKDKLSAATADQFTAKLNEAKEIIDIIIMCAKQQTVIVSDVLDYSKLQRGHIELDPSPFELIKTINLAIDMYRKPLEAKRIDLEIICPTEPLWLKADPTRLLQILNNLLSNAVKFTLKGKITLNLTYDSVSSSETMLHFIVSDTGIGMTTEELNRLFERFVQANRRTSIDFGGSGLGLAITKELVERMGGSITVESIKDKGTTFRFSIKTESLSSIEKARIEAENIRQKESTMKIHSARALSLSDSQIIKLSVLIVDDSKVNQAMLAKIIKGKHCDYQTASDGLEAFEIATRVNFDIIFMDIEMPKMDGLEATALIRKHEIESGHRSLIIALSGYTRNEIVEKAMSIGVDEYISKPYDKEQIYALLDKSRHDKYARLSISPTKSYSTASIVGSPYTNAFIDNDPSIYDFPNPT